MGSLEKARIWVGSNLVRLGIRLLGVKAPPVQPVYEQDDDEELDPVNIPTIILSDAAREMLVTGTPTISNTVATEAPLTGSLAARMQQARREMG